MKRNLIYSTLVFGLILSWAFSGAITQLSMGVLSSDDLALVAGICIMFAGLGALIFFIAFRVVQNRFFPKSRNATYQPSIKFAVVAATLLTIVMAAAIPVSYSEGKKKLETLRVETKRKQDVAQALAEIQEKEKQRLAAMTPQEREAELRKNETQRLAAMTPQQREAEAKEKEKQRLAAMTPQEREAELRKKQESAAVSAIQDAEAMLKRWRERESWAKAALAGTKLKEPDSKPVMKTEWADVISGLKSIKEGQSQYPKAQALLKVMADEDRKAAAESAAREARARVDARKEFAKNLEQGFIEKRMDTDITASGPKNTVLSIKWVLANKVTANDLSKSGILDNAERAGFKKVIFTDGYSRQWLWELKPQPD